MSDGQLKLNCWVFGDDPSHIFPVNIVKTETVYTLQKAIIHENSDMRDIPARSLNIRKVAIPMDGDLGAQLKELRTQRDDQPWRPVDELLQVFSDEPIAQHVHIVVQYANECILVEKILTLEEKRRENQEILNHTLDSAKDLFSTLAVIATFLGGAEATIISFISTASDKNNAWKAAIVMAYVVIISSMAIAMLSALFGVFCTREKLLTPYKLTIMKNTKFSARVQAGYGNGFSRTIETSSIRMRDTASTTIHVFSIVENAADDLVGALAFTFVLAIAVLLLYVWSIPDLPTSVTVTAFVALMIIVIIYNNKRYIVLPRSVVPVPPVTNVSVTSEGKLPGAQVVSSQLITVDFFSNTAKPALHNIDRKVVKTKKETVEGNITTKFGGVTASKSWHREENQRFTLEQGTPDVEASAQVPALRIIDRKVVETKKETVKANSTTKFGGLTVGAELSRGKESAIHLEQGTPDIADIESSARN